MENNNITQQANNVVLENTNKPTKFDLIARWFVVGFVFLHFLFSIYSVLLFLTKGLVIPLIFFLVLILLSVFIFWGILKNKIWGYVLSIVLFIGSGITAYVITANIDIFSRVYSFVGSNSFFLNYIKFIHPAILLMVFIFSVIMIFRLRAQQKYLNINVEFKNRRKYWFRGYVAIISSILLLISNIIIATAKDGEVYGVVPLILALFWIIIVLIAAFMGPLSIIKGIHFKDRNYIFTGIVSIVILFVSFIIFYSPLFNN